MTTNETERFGLTPEQLDQLFARTGEQLVAQADARHRAAEWPGLVERVLGLLWRRSTAHHDALAAIDGRIAALEAATGTHRG